MTREKQVVSGQLNLPGVVEAQCSNRIDSVFDVTPEQVERLKSVKPKLLGLVCGRTIAPMVCTVLIGVVSGHDIRRVHVNSVGQN